MKLFILVIIAATIIGGFVGGELTGATFTLTGAVIGGVGLASILLGLGAYFDSQEKKKRNKDLPPEMRAVFDRMFNADAPQVKKQNTKSPKVDDKIVKDIQNTMMDLLAQDEEEIARGETPERRLVPHHAIKRDVILKGFNKDYQKYVDQINSLAISQTEKDKRQAEMKLDFKGQISGINQMGPEELDKMIVVMKNTRDDFRELEAQVRAVKSYPFGEDPL